MNTTITRRGFLRGTGATLALSLAHLRWKGAGSAHAQTPFVFPDVSYTGFADVYRGQWRWDSVAK